MKTIKWVIAAVMLAAATPASAASELQTGKAIVWIALGVVFLGALCAILGSLIIFRGNAAPPDEE